MIRNLILVSTLICFDFDIFGDMLVLNIYLKNGFVETCFRQSAKCKMTVQTMRTHHVFQSKLNFIIGFATKTKVFTHTHTHPLSFLCLINSFQRRSVFSAHNRSNRSNTFNTFNKFKTFKTFNTDFSLSGACFGTDITPKCTKWSQIGVHGVKI